MTSERLNCWEARGCGREPGGERCGDRGACPAATDERCDGINRGVNAGRICWAVAGTLCNDRLQGSAREKRARCRRCDFYRRVKYEEGCHFQRVKLGLECSEPVALHRLLNNAQKTLAVGRYIFASLAETPLLRRIAENAQEVLRAESAAVYLRDGPGGRLALKVHCGDLERPEALPPDGDRPAAAAVREGGLRIARRPDGNEWLVAAISIGGERGRTGALEVVKRAENLSADDEFFLWEFALMAGLGIANARHIENLHELREYDKAKSRFVALLMHHIGSPLATVATSLEAIRRLGDDLSDADREEMIQYSLDHVDSIQTLSRKLLDLERIRSGRSVADREPVDLVEAIQQEIASHAAAAQEKGVQIELRHEGPRPTVLADEDGLRLIFGNLLDNAIKYSVAPDLRIEVEVSTGADEASAAVRDHGIGIPQEEQTGIFEEFRRAGNAAEGGSSGFGLGLAFVKELVDRYEGSVALESAEGRGTTITVDLPLAEDERRAS